MAQHAKVDSDNDRDKGPQQHQELALRDEVGLAGFVDQFRDLSHGAVHGQILQAHEDDHAETEAENAEEQANHEETMAVDSEEGDRGKVGEFEGRLAARFFGGLRQCVADGQEHQSGRVAKILANVLSRSNVSQTSLYRHKIGVPSAHSNPPKDPSGVTMCDLAPAGDRRAGFNPRTGRTEFEHASNTLPPPG